MGTDGDFAVAVPTNYGNTPLNATLPAVVKTPKGIKLKMTQQPKAHSNQQPEGTQHSTAQHSTAQHSTAQHSTAQH
jgi:hypothetical protein